jgi:hypothetical protein
VTNILLQKCPRTPRGTRASRIFHAPFFAAILVIALVFFGAATTRAQTPREPVGRVEGHDFVVENSIGEPVPAGEQANLLSSGSRLVVRSGQARILLEGGGDILICGAAQIDLLKSQGSITIALNHGTLRVHVKKSDPVAIFTPLVLATTVAIGGGERDVTIGLEQSGQMCIRAISGAVRVGQQLSGESLLVPQFGGLTLSGAQINAVSASAPGCTCEADAARLAPPRVSVTPQIPGANIAVAEILPQFSAQQIGTPLQQTSSAADASTPPVVAESPLSVLMPSLVFNASSPDEPPDAAIETVALARSVRIREDTIVRGTVEPKGNVASVPAVKKASDSNADHPGVFAKIGGFFRKLFGGSS